MPAATFRKYVYPLFFGMQFVQSHAKGPQSATFFGNGDATDNFHPKAVFASKRLCIHRNPRLTIPHCLHDANHIPSVHVVADGHHTIGEKPAVFTYFLTTFYLQAKPDKGCRKSHKPYNKVYDEMPYFEFQRFIKIGVGSVESDILKFPSYGKGTEKRC